MLGLKYIATPSYGFKQETDQACDVTSLRLVVGQCFYVRNIQICHTTSWKLTLSGPGVGSQVRITSFTAAILEPPAYHAQTLRL